VLDLGWYLGIFSMKAHLGLPFHFCMGFRHSCVGRTLVFISVGHETQMAFELDRIEIFRIDSSIQIVDTEPKTICIP
jgi:hypothetical protein